MAVGDGFWNSQEDAKKAADARRAADAARSAKETADHIERVRQAGQEAAARASARADSLRSRDAPPMTATAPSVPSVQVRKKSSSGLFSFIVLAGVIAFIIHAVSKTNSSPEPHGTRSAQTVAPRTLTTTPGSDSNVTNTTAPVPAQIPSPQSTGQATNSEASDIASSQGGGSMNDSAGNQNVYEQAVKDDIAEYIAAAPAGFQQFKTGQSRIVDGHEMWSARKPLLAQSCVVVVMESNVLSCTLSRYKTLQEAETAYKRLVGDVEGNIPTWTQTPNPFKAEIESVAFTSGALGLEGEIWIHGETENPEWTLHYQISK